MKFFMKLFCVAVFAILETFAGGCVGNRLVVNAVEIENDADLFQYWEIVIDTLQDTELTGWADLQIEMSGRMKWLRIYDKYCGKAENLWGSWYVWMFHDENGMTYCPASHSAARPSKHVDGCDCLYARIFVPVHGAIAQHSYLIVPEVIDAQKPDFNNLIVPIVIDVQKRNCDKNDGVNNRAVDITRFDHVEMSELKGEIRIPVKLFKGAKVKFVTTSKIVRSLRTEKREVHDIREIIDYLYVPDWGDR